MQKLIIGLLKTYKLLISPWLGRNCRFHPGCANYAIEAVSRYGALRGSWLAARRLGKCHPWHPGGYDPVPDPARRRAPEQAREKSLPAGY